jgi:transposase-like protein
MAYKIERRTYSPQQKLEWGKEFHESGMKREEAVKRFGVSASQVDYYVRAYRLNEGLTQPHDPPNTSDQKALAIIAKLKGKKNPLPRKTNGSGNQVVPYEPAMNVNLQGYIDRINELEADLDKAMEEVHTLQKLLMTVGKTL